MNIIKLFYKLIAILVIVDFITVGLAAHGEDRQGEDKEKVVFKTPRRN
ncbi:MAG: hypothetical protein V3T79_04515 [Candidatus Scalindua sediminis]|jgi:hypothetical protein